MNRDLPWIEIAPGAPRLRALAAALLRAVGAALDHLASRLTQVERPVLRPEPVLEFHAEAGAPEGALYVNGRLFGHLPGISRL
jgi:hypothetical protein